MSRLEPPSPETMTDEQRRLYEEFNRAHAGKGGIQLTHLTWMRSPELARHIAAFGPFLRYHALKPRQRELAILVTGRHCRAPIEWHDHLPFAREAALDEAVIEALRDRRRPAFARADEEAVYEAASELLDRYALTQATYDKAMAALGAKGLVELIALVGYYAMVAMLIGAFKFEPPAGAAPEFTD